VRGAVHAASGGPLAYTGYGELGFTYAVEDAARVVAIVLMNINSQRRDE
jgi:hypothetical protein